MAAKTDIIMGAIIDNFTGKTFTRLDVFRVLGGKISDKSVANGLKQLCVKDKIYIKGKIKGHMMVSNEYSICPIQPPKRMPKNADTRVECENALNTSQLALQRIMDGWS